MGADVSCVVLGTVLADDFHATMFLLLQTPFVMLSK